ncbi:MAG: thermonuclease family protein [Candidatus Bilamarchaeaceae archaeon]
MVAGLSAKKVAVGAAIVIAALLIVPPLAEGIQKLTMQRQTVQVTRVIDGDTVEVKDKEGGDRMRVIGINAPEKTEKGFSEAKLRMEALAGTEIEVSKDPHSNGTDMYGRLIGYLFKGGKCLNVEMVREGYATAYIYQGEKLVLGPELISAEKEAENAGRGIWAPSKYSKCFQLGEFVYDPQGDDLAGDERVSLRNSCGFAVAMGGFYLKDAGTTLYFFGNGTAVSASGTITVHSGCGMDSASDLYWCRKTPVWNNAGDRLFLRDSDGKLVINYDYGNQE